MVIVIRYEGPKGTSHNLAQLAHSSSGVGFASTDIPVHVRPFHPHIPLPSTHPSFVWIRRPRHA